jgi:hypothetical protein
MKAYTQTILSLSALLCLSSSVWASAVERLDCPSLDGPQPHVLISKTAGAGLVVVDHDNKLSRFQITKETSANSRTTLSASLVVPSNIGAIANRVEVEFGPGADSLKWFIGGSQTQFSISCRPTTSEEPFICIKNGLLYEVLQSHENAWQYRASEEQPGIFRGPIRGTPQEAWVGAHEDCGE